jgi:hypothetical protein
MVESADRIAALMPHAEGNSAAMIQIANRDGQSEQALAQCRKALGLAPRDAELAAQTNMLSSEDASASHIVIVRDELRNTPRRAIESAAARSR